MQISTIDAIEQEFGTSDQDFSKKKLISDQSINLAP